MSAVLTFHDVTVSRGPRVLLDRVAFTVAPGARVGVVGPNGVGKSTLLQTAAGLVAPDTGRVELTPPTATVGLLRQEPERSDESVRDLLRRRTGVAEADAELEAASTALADGEPGAADRYDTALTGLAAGVLLVSHDRRFLDRVTTDIAEIDHHEHTVALYGGGWQAYLDERDVARRRARERFEEYDEQRRSLAARAQRQREWAQQGQAKVQRSANDEPDKNIRAFRINQTEQLAGKAAQTQRAIDRLEVVESPREPWELRLDIPDAPRSGDIVARASGAVVERGSFRLGPIDLLVEYGDRVALTGPNGAGKTTLIDLLLGRVTPDDGAVSLGSGVIVGEIEQARRALFGETSLLRTFMDATGLPIPDTRTLLAKFGLVGDHVERSADSLSPGERTRASLALLMANGANLLVLDEPTNHLDLPAIEQLEQALDTFAGTIVLVTHDREFLDRVRVTVRVDLAGGRLTSTSG